MFKKNVGRNHFFFCRGGEGVPERWKERDRKAGVVRLAENFPVGSRSSPKKGTLVGEKSSTESKQDKFGAVHPTTQLALWEILGEKFVPFAEKISQTGDQCET